jgi:plasmid stabilization system protein ParE
MTSRYILAPQAAQDLVDIWNYIKDQSGEATADRVEAVIRDRIAFLSSSPGAGHWRKDLTDEIVKFFSAYSYLIVYRPNTKPYRLSLFCMADAMSRPF